MFSELPVYLNLPNILCIFMKIYHAHPESMLLQNRHILVFVFLLAYKKTTIFFFLNKLLIVCSLISIINGCSDSDNSCVFCDCSLTCL